MDPRTSQRVNPPHPLLTGPSTTWTARLALDPLAT